MASLVDQLQNPLTRRRDARDRGRLETVFPDLVRCSHRHFLALRPYLDGRPERFFDTAAYRRAVDWLLARDAKDRDGLQTFLTDVDPSLNQAFSFLRDINAGEWHDQRLDLGDRTDLIRFIERSVHPAYLRLCEGVLVPLLKPLAYFSRIDRGKSADSLKAYDVTEELARGGFGMLVGSHSHLLRNAIAHGGITYLQDEIRYTDDKRNQDALDMSDVVRLCDDLLDTCNGLAAGFKVFLISFRDMGYALSRELLIDELREETCAPWWRVEDCVESTIGSQKQLIVYARPNSRDPRKVQWSAFQTGIMAEYFAAGYDRYFLSLRSPIASGWAGFDGTRLRDLRATGADLSDYTGVLENNLIFYVPKPALPRLLARVQTWLVSLRLQWPLAAEDVRRSRGVPHIVGRHAEVHRNSWGCVLRGQLVIDDLQDATAQELITANRRRIKKAAHRAARKDASRLSLVRYLPIGYMRVSIFRRDFRARRLSGFGLGEDLVCTVQLQRIRRIQSPDIFGSTTKDIGKWRIAWNKAWLENTDEQRARVDCRD